MPQRIDATLPHRQPLWVWLVLAAVLILKIGLIFERLPVMTIYLDEVFYYSSSFDLLHFGQPGVPHPRFLRYPPLTSLLVAPLHFLELAPPRTYQLSLAVLSLALATVPVATHLLYLELFGRRSRLVVLLALFSVTAYHGLSLMSEPLFICCYMWGLYFLVRFVKSGGNCAAAAAGLAGAAMILTRSNGMGIVPAMAAAAALDLWLHRGEARRRWRGYLLLLALPLAAQVGLRIMNDHLADPNHLHLSAAQYVSVASERLAQDPEEILSLAAKTSANLSYVALASYGFAVPMIVAFLIFAPRAELQVPAVLLTHVAVFLLFCSAAAAVHMFIYSVGKEDVAKYSMYGRYVDYFTIPLLVMALGALDLAWRELRARRAAIVTATAVLTTVCFAVVPWQVFDRYLAGEVLRLNHNEGVGWLLLLVKHWGSWALLPAVALAAGLAAALLSARFRTSPGWRFSVGAALVGWTVVSAVLAGRETVAHSQALARYRGECSSYVTDLWPSLPAAQRLYLDFNFLDKSRGRQTMLTVYVDHIDKITMGTRAEEHLGQVPVFSRRDFTGYEVLCAEGSPANGGAKLYGTRLADDSARGGMVPPVPDARGSEP